MKKEQNIYRKLQQHIDHMPVGFPESKTGLDIKILKELFSKEDALITLCLSMLPEKEKKIYKRYNDKSINFTEFCIKLNDMTQRGLILKDAHPHYPKYGLSQFAIGIYEFQAGRQTQTLAENVIAYEKEVFGDELHKTKLSQMRTIPISINLEQDNKIEHYENFRAIIKNVEGKIAVATCVCRESHDLAQNPCKQTSLRETCFTINGAAEHYVEMGIARYIEKDEALSILEEAQRSGLVLQPGNTINPSFICCCCGCCCGIITTAKKFSQPAEMIPSNFIAQVDVESCTGCSLCKRICPMDAIEIKDKIAHVDLNRCIGCGNCTTVCKSASISLKQKKKIKTPPPKSFLLYMFILKRKIGLKKLLKSLIKLGLGRQV
jgi:electron transport complex protein RnfB